MPTCCTARRRDPVFLSQDVQPALGGDLLPLLGNKRALVGQGFQCDPDDLLLGCHLEVQLHLDRFLEQPDITVNDVAAVFPEVDRDSIGTAQFGQGSGPDRIGFDGLPCLADRGHVVDVDSQAWHRESLSWQETRCPGQSYRPLPVSNNLSARLRSVRLP